MLKVGILICILTGFGCIQAYLFTVDPDNLNDHLTTAFSSPRPAGSDNNIVAAEYIKDTMQNYTDANTNLVVEAETMPFQGGTNLVWTFKSANWGTASDEVLVLASRFDSWSYSEGVDGNGSGMAAFLEIGRILALALGNPDDCPPVKSVMLVALDAEVDDALGSTAFIASDVMTQLISDHKLKGVILLEHLMNYDSAANSQTLPTDPTTFQFLAGGLYAKLNDDDFQGNFWLILSRYDDESLADLVKDNWQEFQEESSTTYDVRRFVLPFYNSPPAEIVDYFTSFWPLSRQQFWQENDDDMTSIVITDTLRLRGVLNQCEADHYSVCDNSTTMNTPQNRQFLADITGSLARTLLVYSLGEQGPYTNCVGSLNGASTASLLQAEAIMAAVPVAISLLLSTMDRT